MCECSGNYKCWKHFVGVRPITASVVMEFEAQPKPSIYAEGVETIECCVCEREIPKSDAQHVPAIGWRCKDGMVPECISPAWSEYFAEPLVKEADPELERLLAEEEDIVARDAFNLAPNAVHTVGDMRRALEPFTDDMDLMPVVQIQYEMDLRRGSKLRIVKFDDTRS